MHVKLLVLEVVQEIASVVTLNAQAVVILNVQETVKEIASVVEIVLVNVLLCVLRHVVAIV